MSTSNEFVNIVCLTSADGDSQYHIMKRSKKGLSMMEKAYCLALFTGLAEEFERDLSNAVGEERAYLAKEYQKISIKNLKAAIERIIKEIDTGLRSKDVTQALDHIKEVNQDIEGLSDEQ